MRELTYFVACTTDGFIARSDGSFDCFPTSGPHFADLFSLFPETAPTHLRPSLNIQSENRCFDTVLMGRKTYQVGLDIGIDSPYQHLRQYVFSRSLKATPADVALVSSDPVAAVRRLKQEPGKNIWLCGGSELASALLPEIDELILKVNPILIGSGIPLFAVPADTRSLDLVSTTAYPNGFLMTRYRVRH